MQFADETVEKLKAPSFFLSCSEREKQHENYVNVDDEPPSLDLGMQTHSKWLKTLVI